ncbi:SNF2 family DNA or RNA helicase [Salirhabdus euzebyi]|uniref:SNF2 family DNA or RNA helicase n=1 Tax=Salirhabdus euzebyi TaxID=394506 RepID=A0A841Q7Y3_9BACI|nr:DEAD/DEAH box helicase [Salirhabdus euzebyi]MBB6454485.1 SNF2 family DNA or RNA helicase [Salirhabdus euzebyi]
MLNRQSIKNMFPDTIYRRGLSYYNQARVQQLTHNEHQNVWNAKVMGTHVYDVEVEILDNELSYVCDCPAHDQYGFCKHSVAVLLEMLEMLVEDADKEQLESHLRQIEQHENKYQQGEELLSSSFTSEIINLFSNEISVPKKTNSTGSSSLLGKPLKVEFHIKHMPKPWDTSLLSIEMKIGIDRVYVVKKLKELLDHIERQEELYFTQKFVYDPNIHFFEQGDLEVIQLLLNIYKSENFYHQRNRWLATSSNDKGMTIPPYFADQLLSFIQYRNCSFEYGDNMYPQIEWKEQKLPFNFELKENKDHFVLDLDNWGSTSYLEEYGYLLLEHQIYKLNPAQAAIIKGLDRVIWEDSSQYLPIQREQLDSFLSYVLPKFKKVGEIKIQDKIAEEIIEPSLDGKLYLYMDEGRLLANLEYHYDDIIIYPFHTDTVENVGNSKVLVRDIEQEQEIMHLMEHSFFKFNGEQLYIEDEEAMFDFMYEFLPRFDEKLNVFMTNQVRNLLLEESKYPSIQVELDARQNFLEVNFDLADIDNEEVSNILSSIVEKKRFYRLPNGVFVPLEEQSFHHIGQMLTELQLKTDAVQDGRVKLPAFRSLQVEELLSIQDRTKYNEAFRKLIDDIKHPEQQEYPLPENLQAEMRSYQKVGFQWLKALNHYRFGGILADDMGLGKTLQTIALLLSDVEANSRTNRNPAIVISPASLVYNWKSEFSKFAPSLSVRIISGTKIEREQLLQDISDVDVIITSYPLVRQDVKLYSSLEFSTCILDEAQAIKNDTTKTAKAVKSIRAGNRFALSGTPIENSLDELWSLFDAILPGYFPNKKGFNSIPQDQISRMSRPFILRRLKKDVLKELPDKIETVHTSELTKEQKQLYVGYLEKIQNEASEAIASEGFQKSRIKILAGLTRLRQLCCHPSLFIENYEGESGKLNQLLDMIDYAIANKQRILIFSQFASMLKIINEKLALEGYHCFYLDGQTPSQKRVEMAERFNQGENDIFLISLKAGGTGLNLTGADTVILYDLWWNPAVEEQAAGRAHRMGQKKVVQVYRLISEGTIEEKIYSLQQKKRELIENIIQPGETMFSSLSENEIMELLSV